MERRVRGRRIRRGSSALEAGGSDPEAFAPIASGGDALEGELALVGEVEDVGDAGHRFEAEKAAARGRVDNGYGVFGSVDDADFLLLALEPEFGVAFGVGS